jgi:hypothetical protein
METSFSGGRSRSIRREPPTMGKQLVSFTTCGCESSAPFFVIYKAGREPTPYYIMFDIISRIVGFVHVKAKMHTTDT